MPKIPFPTVWVAQHLPFFPGRSPAPPLLPLHPSAASLTMTAGAKPTCRKGCGEIAGPRGCPIPLYPPYPPLSKEVELRRAMSAASRSALFALADGDIVFQDPWLAVVNKPPGVYCETLLSAYSALALLPSPPPPPPSGESSEPPSQSCLLSLDESAGGEGAASRGLHLANRLDRDTSGLMVITKSHKAAAKLVKAFTDHRVKKTYVALCTGKAPAWKRIRISSGHGRSKFGAWRVYSTSDVGRSLPGGSVVKHMATSFELLPVNGRAEFMEPADGVGEAETMVVEEKAVTEEEEMGRGDGRRPDEIIVRAYPESGRTHQVRLHCQYLGMPIKGDVKYGGVCEWEGAACEFHALHAESLRFEHPVTGAPLRFYAPLPPWAKEAFGAMV